MAPSNSIDAVLDFAIREEAAAVYFYQALADRVQNKAIGEVILGFAAEEEGHKRRLEGVKQGGAFTLSAAKGPAINLADYLIEAEVSDNMDLQDVYIVAMKKEKAAFRLYSDLAARAEDAAVQKLFRELAQEEARHKLRFEVDYDEMFLKEN